MVTVLEVWDTSLSSSIPRLFVSSDNGATFAALPAPDPQAPYVGGMVWWSAVFTSALDGVAVDGANANYLIDTSDGGRTWSRVALAGLPVGQYIALGTPALLGDTIELPVFAAQPSSSGTETFLLLESQNGGASFTGPLNHPVSIIGSGIPGPVPVAFYGSSIWLALPDGTALRSINYGATWSTVTLPTTDADSLGLSGQATAILTAGGGLQCTGTKAQPNCSTTAITVWETTDGGSTWQNVTPS
jgi:photosystem II stability/assembly factor-like uncharacterized protein